VLSDGKIVKHLHSYAGVSFLDMISTSDIAYVLTIVKNQKEGWDEKMKTGMYIHVAKLSSSSVRLTSQFVLALCCKVTPRKRHRLYTPEERAKRK